MQVERSLRHVAVGRAPVLILAISAVVFFVLSTVFHVPFSNQNTYLLHASVGAADDPLAGDWLAGTADPFPFATMLSKTALRLGDFGVYALFFVCTSALLLGLLIFAIRHGRIETSKPSLLLSVFLMSLPFVEPALPLFANFRYGVAGQSLLNGFWEPSVGAGTAIALALLSFASGHSRVAALLIALAVTLHPGYLLAGAIVMAVICVRLLVEGQTAESLVSGTLCLVLVLPITGYALTQFGGTDPTTFAEAQAIVARERIPHHAIPHAWLSFKDGIRIALVVVAALLWRGHARLVWMLIGCTALAARPPARGGRKKGGPDHAIGRSRGGLSTKIHTVVDARGLPLRLLLSAGQASDKAGVAALLAATIIAMILDKNAVYLLFPWRISVALAPLSYCLIVLRVTPLIADALVSLARRWGAPAGFVHGLVAAGFLVLFGLSLSAGAVRDWRLAAAGLPGLLLGHVRPDPNLAPERLALYDWVASNTPAGNVYLIPIDLAGFRLSARQPVYADGKSHPYKDVEVIAWKQRLDRAAAAYAVPDACGRPALAPDALLEVTRIVFHKVAGCALGGRRLYENEVYAVVDRGAAYRQ